MASAFMVSSSTATAHFLRLKSHSSSPSVRQTASPWILKICAQITGEASSTPLIRRLTTLLKPAVAVAAALAVAAPAAVAEEMEKAALFDFNLTLPAIALEFVLLMVALDKINFTSLGKFMDERDAAIRAQLGDVKDTSEKVKQLEEQAVAVMKAARAEISAALNQMKKATTVELELKLADRKKKVERPSLPRCSPRSRS